MLGLFKLTEHFNDLFLVVGLIFLIQHHSPKHLSTTTKQRQTKKTHYSQNYKNQKAEPVHTSTK